MNIAQIVDFATASSPSSLLKFAYGLSDFAV